MSQCRMTNLVDGISALNVHFEFAKNISSKQYLFSNGIMGEIQVHYRLKAILELNDGKSEVTSIFKR